MFCPREIALFRGTVSRPTLCPYGNRRVNQNLPNSIGLRHPFLEADLVFPIVKQSNTKRASFFGVSLSIFRNLTTSIAHIGGMVFRQRS
jgi:hypothetical protein